MDTLTEMDKNLAILAFQIYGEERKTARDELAGNTVNLDKLTSLRNQYDKLLDELNKKKKELTSSESQRS